MPLKKPEKFHWSPLSHDYGLTRAQRRALDAFEKSVMQRTFEAPENSLVAIYLEQMNRTEHGRFLGAYAPAAYHGYFVVGAWAVDGSYDRLNSFALSLTLREIREILKK